ncbi:MAG TPA: YciI family protein [Hypericibacter adhaerens]|uniref:YciI family protein n=1 Tax=Hypericibacter adhaerens TaxID=2602016 RepID=UPI002CE2CA33|nr:YciI family protein [Hypericibacter adhaerens]HWA45160.1 YciI family protein [Hypericibacter adhaerens]
MLFALVALDRPDAVGERLRLRPEHLKHLDGLGDRLLLAGPFLNERGEGVGSIVVIEAETLGDARAAFNRDPYVAAGLFDTVMIKPWKMTIDKTK